MQSKLIAQPADCALVEMLFVKTSVIQIRFRLSAAHEGAKQSSRGDDVVFGALNREIGVMRKPDAHAVIHFDPVPPHARIDEFARALEEIL